jgi:hypothetical protein
MNATIYRITSNAIALVAPVRGTLSEIRATIDAVFSYDTFGAVWAEDSTGRILLGRDSRGNTCDGALVSNLESVRAWHRENAPTPTPAVDHVMVFGPLAPDGKRCASVASARRAVGRLDAKYGASQHTYRITYQGIAS